MLELVTDFLEKFGVWQQALILGLLTWFLTAIGAYAIYIVSSTKRAVADAMLGFAGGIMLSASFWSLLLPAVDMSSELHSLSWLPVTIGFIVGLLCMRAIDIVIPHLHIGFRTEEAEGIKTSWQRSVLFVLAVTMHNIPEGLAVGVAVGSAAFYIGLPLMGALSLAIGIGIQNLPEGFAVAAALRREGVSKAKSAFYGQLSAVVEPIFSVIGAITVTAAKGLLPYALGFAAGAMLFIIVEEVIPESQREGNTDLSTMMFMLGFLLMMALDTAFG